MTYGEMIQDALAQLDREHVNQLADAVRSDWARARAIGRIIGVEPFEASYMPGDGTFYALLFVPLAQEILGAPGGGTGGVATASGLGVSERERDGRYALVYYAQRNRGLVVRIDEFVAPDRIESHLDVKTASLVAVAVFLNRVTGQDDACIDRWIEANS